MKNKKTYIIIAAIIFVGVFWITLHDSAVVPDIIVKEVTTPVTTTGIGKICDYITLEEAKTINPEVDTLTDKTATSCFISKGDPVFNKTIIAQFSVSKKSSDNYIDIIKDNVCKKDTSKCSEVTNLGDRATWINNTIYVTKGDKIFVSQKTNLGSNEPIEKLAEIVISKL